MKFSNVLHGFARSVERAGERTALEYGSVSLTFHALDARASRLAATLAAAGAEPGAPVAVLARDTAHVVTALLGVLKAACAFVPLDPSMPAPRMDAMLGVAAPRWLLAEPALLEQAAELAAPLGATVVCLAECAALPAGVLPLLPPEGAARVPARAPAGPDDLAYIYFTSGSTGTPKGIAGRHKAVDHFVRWEIARMGLGDGVRVSQLTTPSFDAFLRDVLVPLCAGGTICAPESRETVLDARRLVRWLSDARVQVLHCVPSLFRAIMAEAGDPALFPALTHVLMAGETLLPGDVRRWTAVFGDRVRLVNLYGPSETTMVKFSYVVQPGDGERRFIPIGRPMDGAAALLLDAAGRLAPRGTVGEICIRTPFRSLGYYGRPDLTARAFVPNPFGGDPDDLIYRTGDYGRELDDGAYEFLGRRDQQVKVRGVRVEVQEIEDLLRAHASVRDAAVAHRGDDEAGRTLVAYLAGDAVDVAGARAHLAAHLPEYLVPSRFVALDALPRTISGKVDRNALPDPALVDAGAEFVAPRTPTEEIVAGIWRDILGVERVGATDSFFEIGGHSLMATRVASRIREALGAELPLREVFEAATLADLAARADAARRTLAPPMPAVAPVGRGQALPLSFAQERLWFIDRLSPGQSAYNTPAAVRLDGPLNVEAMRGALSLIVARHEALRTVFREVDGAPVQWVRDAEAVRLRVESLDVADGEAEARRVALEEAGRGFDLGGGPLYRARLLRISDRSHVLLFTTHHVVMDDWSLGIFYRELTTAYAALAEGRAPELAALAVQYPDFAAWQRAHVDGPALERQLAYWAGRLAGAPERLAVPTDRARPALPSYRGALVPFTVPAELTERLREVSRAGGGTLYMTMMAAFQLLLSRWARQDDVVVGSPIAGRTRGEVEGLIGFFVNTLVVRTDLSGNPTFRELVGRVRETTLQAYDHQDVPFERLVDELKVERSLAHNPLFQVMFSMQNLPARELQACGLTLSGMGVEAGVAKFDLRLIVNERQGDMLARLEFATDLFERDTVQRMGAQLMHLLGQIAADPDQRLGHLSLLDDESRAAVLAIGAARGGFASDDTLHGVFAAQAAARPSALALSFDGERMAYAELDARSNQLARHLRSMGVGAEVKVGLFADRGMDLVVAILAVLKAGGAYVPMDPAYPADRLQYMLEDSGAAVLLTQYELRDKLPDLPCPALYLDSDWSLIERQSSEPVDVQTTADSLAYVIYTSGSTGKPKGCEITHRNVVRLFRSTEAEFAFSADDVWTMFHSAAFDFSVWEIWGALLYGGRVVIVPFLTSREPEQFHRLMRKEGVTMLSQTPSAFRQLMQADSVSPELRALRCVVFGGEALEPGSLAEWVERYGDERPQLVNMYGITETTVHVTYRRIRRADVQAGAKSPIGVPIADLSAYVLDAMLNPVPIGVAGELCVGGAGVARGYLNRPELTAERFINSPFVDGERLYRSGDLARWLPTGELEYLGRIDEQVKVRGFRIELGEIEAVLHRHSAVTDAVVVIRKDADGSAQLVGYAASTAPADDLREHLRGSLPEYMVPTALVVLDALPLTVNGKVDRKRLPEPDAAGAESHAFVAPTTETEAVLAAIWAEVLKLERVGANDRFFDLGGHSLRATQVAARVRAQLGVEMPLRPLFEGATVAQIAAQLDEARASDGGEGATDEIRRLDHGGDLALSFAQERLWFMDQMEPDSSAYNMALTLRLTGELHRAALEAALTEVVRRHESLRTVFRSRDGKPVQVILNAEPFVLEEEDLAYCEFGEREEEMRALAAEEARRPFDLAEGLLFRARLLYVCADEHVLLITTHHIVSDGWSTGVLLRELDALYRAYAAGEESPLADLPIQYADFAAWQRERLSGERLDAELGYWKGALAGAPAVLELPTDRPRPAVRRYQGATRSALLPLPVLTAVYELARAEEATPFMVLLAAYDALLARYAGADDVVVGTPTAGRTRAEVEGMIGFFVSTLALRTSLAGEPTFRELVARVRETTIGAFAHQELPFDRVVEAVAPERNLSHNPVFQVAFNLQNTGAGAPRLGDLEVGFVGAERTIAKFDLTLTCVERVDGLATVVEYDTDLFDDATAERILAHFGTLLEQACAQPGLRLPELSLLDDDARQQVLHDWNRTTSEYPADASIVDLFREQARARPDATAVRYGAEQLTYAELDRRSDALAMRLVTAGVGPETRVGLCAERGVGMVGGMLAILKAGGAYVPLDPAYPAERLGFMLQDAGITILLAEDGLEGIFAGSAVRTLRLVLDEPTEPIALPATAGGDALAYVIYTSGSTGRPKGIGVPHRGVVRLVRGTDYAQLTVDDRVAQASNASFDAATFEVWGALLNGAALVGFDRETTLTPSRFKVALRDERITTLFLTTALFNQSVREEGDVFATLTHVLFGGELVDPAVVRRCLEQGAPQRLLHVYGPTESTTFSSWQLVSEVAEDAVTVPIGRGIANTTLYVLDAWLRPVPAGVPGELFVGGDGIARGYLGRPGLSADRFIPDPFAAAPGARMYRTGDVVRWNAAGRIEFRGRVDHQVKLRGFRIELGEIESALLQQPGVNEAVVMVRADGASGARRLVAYVGGRAAPAELKAALGAALPDYMVPALFVVLDALPLNPNGKVDRNRLPEAEFTAGDDAFVAPRTPAEEILARVWGEVLGVGRVGVHDNFFGLGGDSILSIQVVARAARAGLKVTLRQLFERQTVATLAEVAQFTEAAADTADEAEGEVPLLPVQQWFLGQGWSNPHHFNQGMLLHLREPLPADVVDRALTALVEHHDALRVRVHPGAGGWRAAYGPAAGALGFDVVDLSGVETDALPARVEAECSARHAALHLGDGPVARAVLFECGPERGQRLFVAIHHMAVDGVSWRVILEDLEAACRALAAGSEPELPPRTSTIGRWARGLAALAAGDTLRAELPFWTEHAAPGEPLPVDMHGDNVAEHARTAWVELDEDETRALLQEVPQAYRTQINDVLLAALAAAYRDWTGHGTLWVDMEGHGREEVVDGVDLSRTVGWFTSIYPLRVSIPAEGGEAGLLKSVKEQLRAVPGKGVGFGALRYLAPDAGTRTALGGAHPPISFNYLGQFDRSFAEGGLFGRAAEGSGRGTGPGARRAHLIDVTGSVRGGRLRMGWIYSAAVHREATVQAFADGFAARLRALIAHCRGPGAGGYTQSDFKRARLSQKDLDKLARLVGR